MSGTNTPKLEAEVINIVNNGSVEDVDIKLSREDVIDGEIDELGEDVIDDKVDEVESLNVTINSRNVRFPLSVDLSRVETKLKYQESVKVSQWQVKLIEMCKKINERLKPVVKSLDSISEELKFQVVECKRGKTDNLVGAWLMTIRLVIGKMQFPPGRNDTVAKECWEKLSTLAEIAVLSIQTHKRMYKPTITQLEFVREKYVKYVQMVGRPMNADLPTEVVTVVTDVNRNSREPFIPDHFVPGICSASVSVLERDIILVHDQDRQAPILHIKESEGVGNFSRCIEILKLFIEQTTGMIERSHEKMRSAEKELELIPNFLRKEMSDLLGLLIRYDKAHRLKEKSCSTQLKIAMRSLNDTIKTFLNHIEALKLIYVWVLTAVEACFDKIKESWPNINFTAEPYYRDKYKQLLDPKRNLNWWHPKRLLSSQKLTFWVDISENVGKFEKFFRGWGIEAMQLINLRVSIPTELSSILFAEHAQKEHEYVDSPMNESGRQTRSYYSKVFLLEEQECTPFKGRRHHLSHTNNLFKDDIELDLDENADLPVLEYKDLFPSVSQEMSEAISDEETQTDRVSMLTSPSFSIMSTLKPVKTRVIEMISMTPSETQSGHSSGHVTVLASVESDAKTVKEIFDIISFASKTQSGHTSIVASSTVSVTAIPKHIKEVVGKMAPESEAKNDPAMLASPTVSNVPIVNPVPSASESDGASVETSPTVSVIPTAKSKSFKTQMKAISPTPKSKRNQLPVFTPPALSVSKTFKKTQVKVISPMSETDMASMIASPSFSATPLNAKSAKKSGEIISNPDSETDALTSGFDRNRSIDGDGDDVTATMSLESLP